MWSSAELEEVAADSKILTSADLLFDTNDSEHISSEEVANDLCTKIESNDLMYETLKTMPSISYSNMSLPMVSSQMGRSETLSPTLSSSSSLCLSVEVSDNGNSFLLNRSFLNYQPDPQQHHLHQQQQQHQISQPSTWDNSIVYNFQTACSKQDVSVGTEMIINKDPRYKQDFQWLQNTQDQQNEFIQIHQQLQPHQKTDLSVCYVSEAGEANRKQMESFKMIEKLPPKKQRTKYSKEHISFLERAYEQNEYPDVLLIDNLCKTLAIPKEKIMIWFQNRRARSKKSTSKSNGLSKLNRGTTTMTIASQALSKNEIGQDISAIGEVYAMPSPGNFNSDFSSSSTGFTNNYVSCFNYESQYYSPSLAPMSSQHSNNMTLDVRQAASPNFSILEL